MINKSGVLSSYSELAGEKRNVDICKGVILTLGCGT